MRKYIKSGVAALLVLIFVISTCLPAVAVGQPSSYNKNYNSGERDVVCTTLDGTTAANYYTDSYTYDNLASQSSSQLFSNLRKLMTDTHKKTSSYADCRDMASQTDCENGDGRIVMLYSSYSATVSDYKSGQGWNREHVWPQSLGGGNTSGGGADLHHIRPAESKLNSTRGNMKYGNVSGGKSASGNLSSKVGGTYSSGYFEPNDNVKGDVARIVLYVYVRWGSAWGADSVTEVFQSVDVLLEWCALDPVDTWEMGRNEVVAAYQGNRNVFIDYPEFAWLIFGKDIPSNMTTPSGMAAGQGNSGDVDNPGSGTDNPGTDNPGTDNPGTDNPGTDNPGGDNPGGDNPGTDPQPPVGEKEILDAAYALGKDESMTGPFTLTGVITELDSWNNPTIVVGEYEDQPIYCYKLKDDRFTVGATITVTAESIKNYNGTVEMMNCTLDSIILPGDSGNTPGGDGDNSGDVDNPGTDNPGGDNPGGDNPGGDNPGTDPQPPECTHPNIVMQNVKEADCVNGGYTGDKYCPDCEKIINEGEQTSPTGEHKHGEWQLDEDGVTYVRICSVCGDKQTMTIEYLLSTCTTEAERILILLTFGITDLEFAETIIN